MHTGVVPEKEKSFFMKLLTAVEFVKFFLVFFCGPEQTDDQTSLYVRGQTSGFDFGAEVSL